jgi:hypothetical protein
MAQRNRAALPRADLSRSPTLLVTGSSETTPQTDRRDDGQVRTTLKRKRALAFPTAGFPSAGAAPVPPELTGMPDTHVAQYNSVLLAEDLVKAPTRRQGPQGGQNCLFHALYDLDARREFNSVHQSGRLPDVGGMRVWLSKYLRNPANPLANYHELRDAVDGEPPFWLGLKGPDTEGVNVPASSVAGGIVQYCSALEADACPDDLALRALAAVYGVRMNILYLHRHYQPKKVVIAEADACDESGIDIFWLVNTGNHFFALVKDE